MTREEAIEFGNMWLQINEDSKDSNTYTFFQMAIQALSQELCEDAVSRDAVLQELTYIGEEINPDDLTCIFRDRVRDLPSVTVWQNDFLNFLMNVINPNEMEKYISMYKSNGEKCE